MAYDPEDPNPERCDLISHDLEEYIARHPEGAACLEQLYELYDFWVGEALYKESLPSENASKSRKGGQRRGKEARAWYLSKAPEVQRMKQCTSYSQLSKALWWKADSSKVSSTS